MNPELRTLKMTAYGDTPDDDFSLTINPTLIKAVLTRDGMAQGRPVKVTTILFTDDSEPIVANLNSLDLMELEQVVGAYGFFEHDH